MTLACLFIGAACGKDEEGKATNDSPSTVDEVINTTGITTATTQTTVKPTEKVNEAPTNTPKEEKPEEHEDNNEYCIGYSFDWFGNKSLVLASQCFFN